MPTIKMLCEIMISSEFEYGNGWKCRYIISAIFFGCAFTILALFTAKSFDFEVCANLWAASLLLHFGIWLMATFREPNKFSISQEGIKFIYYFNRSKTILWDDITGIRESTTKDAKNAFGQIELCIETRGSSYRIIKLIPKYYDLKSAVISGIST